MSKDFTIYSTFQKIFLYIVGIVTLLLIVYSYFVPYFILLTSEQIISLLSLCAQIVATLFGLTIAAYIFFNGQLDKKKSEDNSLEDIIHSLEMDNFAFLFSIGLLSVFTIIFCISNIILYESEIFNLANMRFLISESIFLSLSIILALFYLAIKMVNPNLISNMSERLKEEIDSEKGSTNNEQNQVKPNNFLLLYNQTEEMLSRAAIKVINDNPSRFLPPSKTRLSVFESLKILHLSEIIDNSTAESINNLRKYRNYIVHSTNETEASPGMYQEMESMYDQLKTSLIF